MQKCVGISVLGQEALNNFFSFIFQCEQKREFSGYWSKVVQW
jgi:hypothetical protein